MLNIGLIGAGRWGKIYEKTLKNISDITVTIATRNYKDILSDVDCVIIATPANTHFEIAKECLLANKHILVEKPFTTYSDQALELHELSKKVNKVLLVDHIYLHHDGILLLKQLINSNYLGKITEYSSLRMGMDIYPAALWEMMPHDIYILDYFFGNENIEKIEAIGNVKHCVVTFTYKDDLYVVVQVNSHYPKKTRQIDVWGSLRTLNFNDTTIKENGIKEIYLDLSITPLEKQCRHFFDCILNNVKPISDGYEGYKNVKLLEQIEKLL